MGKTLLQTYIDLAMEGTEASIGEIMRHLNQSMTLAESKFMDFALGLIETEKGIEMMEANINEIPDHVRNFAS